MMKKATMMVMVVMMVLALSACGSKKSDDSNLFEIRISNLEQEISDMEDELYNLEVAMQELSATESNDMTQLSHRVDMLEAETVAITSSTEEMENNNDTYFETENLAQIIFWEQGEYYVKDENFVFYDDCYLTTPISSEVNITSDTSVKVNLDNGLTVYCFMSTDGLVWSANKPSIKEVK